MLGKFTPVQSVNAGCHSAALQTEGTKLSWVTCLRAGAEAVTCITMGLGNGRGFLEGWSSGQLS